MKGLRGPTTNCWTDYGTEGETLSNWVPTGESSSSTHLYQVCRQPTWDRKQNRHIPGVASTHFLKICYCNLWAKPVRRQLRIVHGEYSRTKSTRASPTLHFTGVMYERHTGKKPSVVFHRGGEPPWKAVRQRDHHQSVANGQWYFPAKMLKCGPELLFTECPGSSSLFQKSVTKTTKFLLESQVLLHVCLLKLENELQ